MVCVCLHALLATTAQPAKLAIYWKGENVATNGTAAAAVRSRGFTHAVVAHLDSAAALGAASLAPILLLGEQPYAPRAHSPPQSKSKGVALAARMSLVSAHVLRDVLLPRSYIMSVAGLCSGGRRRYSPLSQTLG